jgi:hypothetical protein
MMKLARNGAFIAMIAVLAGVTGCRPKVSKMAQGVTPIVANFYVLNIEIARVRQTVRDAAPAKTDTLQASYQQLVALARTIASEALADEELKKREPLKNAMTSCLTEEMAFLDAEGRAVGYYAAESRLGDQINVLNQHSRGNTIQMRDVETQINALFTQQQQYHKQLVKLLPSLAAAAGRSMAALRTYNSVLAEAKIVNYFNDDGMFKILAWENAGSEHKKIAPKSRHHTVAKPRKTRHK